MEEAFEVRGLVLNQPIRQPHSFCVPGEEKGELPVVLTAEDMTEFISLMVREWVLYEDAGAPDDVTPTEALMGLLICQGISHAQAQSFINAANHLFMNFLKRQHEEV